MKIVLQSDISSVLHGVELCRTQERILERETTWAMGTFSWEEFYAEKTHFNGSAGVAVTGHRARTDQCNRGGDRRRCGGSGDSRRRGDGKERQHGDCVQPNNE